MLIATEASKIHHEPIHPKFTGLSVLHDLDPEYAKFSLEALNETAKAIRDFASKLSARDAPLPLSASYRESFREASPREIQGLDGEGVLRALFEDTADDALLKEVITQGFMEYNPSVVGSQTLLKSEGGESVRPSKRETTRYREAETGRRTNTAT